MTNEVVRPWRRRRLKVVTALAWAMAASVASVDVVSAGSGGTPDERPPLPTAPPDGERVDRHVEALPDDFDPVAWTDLPPRPPLDGPLAVNSLVTDAPRFGEDVLTAPEDVAAGLDGHLYTGTADGAIWRLVIDGRDVAAVERVTTVGGRPLGIAAYSDNVIVVAVALQGLVAVDTDSGATWVLADRLDGVAIFFADGVDVAPDGTIYLTEASTRYYPGFPLDFLDGRPRGRLLRYEPASGVLDVVADELYFANGVVVAPDESYAIVAESFRFRLTRISFEDDGFGSTEQFGPALPNGADNLHRDEDGRIWVGGSDLRSDVTDAALSNVELRRQLAESDPAEIAAAREPYGFSLVLGPEGDLLHSFHDPTGGYFAVSAALHHDGYVTFGSLRDVGVARIPLPAELAG